ncbi:PucR family transcriptional regulator [Lacticaseibacillus sp. GG6-2]
MLSEDLLNQLAQTLALRRYHAPNVPILRVQVADDTLEAPSSGTLYLDVGPHQVTLIVYAGQKAWCLATVTLVADDKVLPLRLLEEVAAMLGQPCDQTALTQLAIAAITADFDTTLAQAAGMLNNPLLVLSLDGQHILRTTNAAVGPDSPVGRFLATHVPALDPDNFYHHLYLTNPDQSPIPLLVTPLSHHNDALGYLAMAVYAKPIAANQTQLLPLLGKLVANAAVQAHVIEPAVSARDRLVNMLLTSPVDSTFAAQFHLQNATLPHSMVVVRAYPNGQQTLEELKEQLKYLATPMFSQFLITIHHHQCVGLITVSLQEYHDSHFHDQLTKLAAHARCHLIVSNLYTRPEDTVAANAVCGRTAKLRLAEPVVFCEDAFFDLMLTQVNDGAAILPFFINPAIKALTRHDATYHTDLVLTLHAYLQATCNQAECATAMYIHPNTLRNRLTRIHSITGLDLKDANTCFKLAASFKVMQCLNANHLHSGAKK